jgi:dihydroorotate dehydrogenase (fumarate)
VIRYPRVARYELQLQEVHPTAMDTPDLSTTYLGLNLSNPLVVAASPLGRSLDNLRRMEDSGAAAVVLPSLFEEQITAESHELDYLLSRGTYNSAGALTYFSETPRFEMTPDQYLDHIQRVKLALEIPVIASLNGISIGGWTDYARLMEDAGADALELNQYFVPTDPGLSSQTIEDEFVEVLSAVKQTVSIPVAVKLSPYFTNLTALASRLDAAGADGLVLFNRFQQPDIDLAILEVVPRPTLSPVGDEQSLRLPLCWIGILDGRIRCSLAASGGIHSATDVLKLIMVGADVTMLASELMINGIARLRTMRHRLSDWLQERKYTSVQQLQGSLSQRSVSFPAAFERAHYVRAVSGGVPPIPTTRLVTRQSTKPNTTDAATPNVPSSATIVPQPGA